MRQRPPYLLPQIVTPERYKLWIEPNFSDFTFIGTVRIAMTVREPTRNIVLHAADLEIINIHLIEDHTAVPRSGQVVLYPNENRMVCTFDEEVSTGHAYLTVNYKGRINDDLNGLYKSTYTIPNGETRIMVASQCEATDFRRICPSIDEPGEKAVIELSVLIPEHLMAISNMPEIKKTSLRDGLKWVFFEPTPVMSTYLFALIVGEFEGVESRTKDGILVRVLATLGKKEQGLFALQEAVRMIEYYTEYFGMPFPLPKYDLIAIPDFAAGAMENWGANTFRESILLSSADSSAATRERIADVIYHEGGHQWHGNLVTMKNWSGLWLNEGFATWLELIAGQKFHPEWNPEIKFIAQDVLGALAAAGLKSSRPIHVDITRESEISEAFDGITYSMGACIIRMLENYVGPEVFRQGLEKYMRRHAYGNAYPEDLWDAIEVVSGKSIKKMMDPWIHQTGYPMISVSRIYDEKGAPYGLKLSQERFLVDKDRTEKESPLWTVPVGVIAEKSAGVPSYLVLDAAEREISFADLQMVVPTPHEWIKLNASHTGFFRVRYEPDDLRALVRAIGDGALGVADRIELIDDTFALTRAGHSRADELLDLLRMCTIESDLDVWSVLLPRMGMLEILASRAGEHARFQSFKKGLVEDIALELGWDENPEDSHQMKTMRGAMLSAYGMAGDTATIEEARARFAAFRKDHNSLNPNLRRAVYGIAAATGDFEMQEILRGLYKEFAVVQEEQNRLLGAMTEFRNPALLARTLEYFISGEVRTQNVFLLMGQVAANPAGADLTWEFLKHHWDAFVEMYEKSKLLGRTIENVCSMLVGPRYEDDVRTFFSTHPVPEAERSIAQSLERIRVNTRWLDRDGAMIASWLRDHYRSLSRALGTFYA